MKITGIFKATGLACLVGAVAVMATPTPEAALEARQFGPFIPILQGLDGVLKYASETLAFQIEGAATDLSQLKYLCRNSRTLTSRLTRQGYNGTFIKESICAASKAPALKTDDEIRKLVESASSKIWTVQALGSTLGFSKALCNAFSAEGGDRVGLDGDFVKQEVCGVAG